MDTRKPANQLISSILEESSDEESSTRYDTVKRYLLLDPEELARITEFKAVSAPMKILPQFKSPQRKLKVQPFNDETVTKSSQAPAQSEWVAAVEYIPSESRDQPSSELQSYLGKLVPMSKKQEQCGKVQKLFELASLNDKGIIFAEILPYLQELEQDICGNYVIQKVFECGLKSQKRMLADSMVGRMVDLSKNTCSCRIVQRALEYAEPNQRLILAMEFREHVEDMIADCNANHVVQKCIEVLPPEESVFILEAILNQVKQWADHQYGCRVIQRILEKFPENLALELHGQLLSNTLELCQKKFGNYVVQTMISLGSDYTRQQILNRIILALFELSQHKFSSNVIEKLVTEGSAIEHCRIFEQLSESGAFYNLLKDKFGNYVLQKLLKYGPQDLQEKMIVLIENNSNVKSYTYGKHILNIVKEIKRHINQNFHTNSKTKMYVSFQCVCRLLTLQQKMEDLKKGMDHYYTIYQNRHINTAIRNVDRKIEPSKYYTKAQKAIAYYKKNIFGTSFMQKRVQTPQNSMQRDSSPQSQLPSYRMQENKTPDPIPKSTNRRCLVYVKPANLKAKSRAFYLQTLKGSKISPRLRSSSTKLQQSTNQKIIKTVSLERFQKPMNKLRKLLTAASVKPKSKGFKSRKDINITPQPPKSQRNNKSRKRAFLAGVKPWDQVDEFSPRHNIEKYDF